MMQTAPDTHTEDRLYTHLLWITALASILIFFWDLGSVPLLSHNEGRRASVVQEMLLNHNWLIPTLNGETYLAKPPLFYWFAALFALIFNSTSEWVMRIPSALSALGLTWMLFDRVKRHIGRWPALLSAIILSTSLKFTLHARRAEIEMLLALCCCLAMLFFLDYLKKPENKRYLYLSYGAMGLAFMTKGPVALLFFIAPLLALWFKTRDSNILKGLSFLRGWLIFALVAFPWYLYIFFSLGDKPVEAVVQKDIVGRSFGSAERDPWFSYFVGLPANFLPWILVIAYRTREEAKAFFSRSETALFGFWFLVPLLIMSLFATKQEKYLLPLYPGVAVVLAVWLDALRVRLMDSKREKMVLRAGYGAVAILVGWFCYYAFVEAGMYTYRYANLTTLARTLQETKGNATVYTYREDDPRLTYYYKGSIPIADENEVLHMIAEQKPFLLVTDARDQKELMGMEGLCMVAELKPYLHKDRMARIYGNTGFCSK